MADFYSEGRQATIETANDIINRLEDQNYISKDTVVRRDYAYVLRKEYEEYVDIQTKNKGQ
jgi:hypothetical protein